MEKMEKMPPTLPALRPLYLDELDISPHKKRILRLRLEGKSNVHISELFGLSIKTIESHLQQIYGHYDVQGLLNLAIKLGWLRVSLSRSDPTESKANIGLTSPRPL